MMGEGKRLENSRRNDENKEDKKKELKTGRLRKFGQACLLTGGILLAGAGLAKCTSDGNGSSSDTSTDGDVTSSCTDNAKSRANLRVKSGWGYNTETEDRRCYNESGCDMGINLWDNIEIVNPDGLEETWTVDSIENALVTLTPTDGSGRTIEIMPGGSVYKDGDLQSFVEVTLIGSCSNKTCENGISVDVDNATGKTMLELRVGGEMKLVLLEEHETRTVSIGGRNVNITLASATESQAYVIVTEVEGTELGTPVNEEESVELDSDLTVMNIASSDSAVAECSDLTVTFEVVIHREGEEDVPFEMEFSEGDSLVFSNGKIYDVGLIVAEITGGGSALDQDVSGVRLDDTGGSESIGLRPWHSLTEGNTTVTVISINGYRPR